MIDLVQEFEVSTRLKGMYRSEDSKIAKTLI
jgi:hypothetical protein